MCVFLRRASSALVVYAQSGIFGVILGADVMFTSWAHENGIFGLILGADVKFTSCARAKWHLWDSNMGITGGGNGWAIFGWEAPYGEKSPTPSALTPWSPVRPSQPTWRANRKLIPSLA